MLDFIGWKCLQHFSLMLLYAVLLTADHRWIILKQLMQPLPPVPLPDSPIPPGDTKYSVVNKSLGAELLYSTGAILFSSGKLNQCFGFLCKPLRKDLQKCLPVSLAPVAYSTQSIKPQHRSYRNLHFRQCLWGSRNSLTCSTPNLHVARLLLCSAPCWLHIHLHTAVSSMREQPVSRHAAAGWQEGLAANSLLLDQLLEQ